MVELLLGVVPAHDAHQHGPARDHHQHGLVRRAKVHGVVVGDEVGDAAGQVGTYALKAANKAQELESEYKVTETVKQKADDLIKQVKDQIS